VFFGSREKSEALKMYHKSLAIEEKALGKDHPDTATSYNNIGGVLKKKGDSVEALKMYHKCLSIREKAFGKDHHLTEKIRGTIYSQ
jgi:tetratricopeptide (TPR) repeat protein